MVQPEPEHLRTGHITARRAHPQRTGGAIGTAHAHAGGPVYRLRQLRRALAARPSERGLEMMRRALSPAQQALFESMSPRDQWHSIETWRFLLQAGVHDPDIRTAALLHDVGKGYIRLPERVLNVAIAPFPHLLQRVAAPGRRGLRAALHRMQNHAVTGARLAKAAGASASAVELISRHHDHDRVSCRDERLKALIRADDLA